MKELPSKLETNPYASFVSAEPAGRPRGATRQRGVTLNRSASIEHSRLGVSECAIEYFIQRDHELRWVNELMVLHFYVLDLSDSAEVCVYDVTITRLPKSDGAINTDMTNIKMDGFWHLM